MLVFYLSKEIEDKKAMNILWNTKWERKSCDLRDSVVTPLLRQTSAPFIYVELILIRLKLLSWADWNNNEAATLCSIYPDRPCYYEHYLLFCVFDFFEIIINKTKYFTRTWYPSKDWKWEVENGFKVPMIIKYDLVFQKDI